MIIIIGIFVVMHHVAVNFIHVAGQSQDYRRYFTNIVNRNKDTETGRTSYNL